MRRIILLCFLPCFLAASVLIMTGCPKSSETKINANAGSAPTTSAISQPSMAPRLPADTVVARWKGGQITYGDLLKKTDRQLLRHYNRYLQELTQTERQELDGMVAEILIKEAATAKGQAEEAYVQSLTKSAQISDDEVQAFYQANVAASGRSFDETRERIHGFLSSQKQQEAFRTALQGLRAEADVKVSLPPPDFARMSFDLSGSPVKGDPNGKVTVVEFSDFECPYCARAAQATEELVKAFPKNLRIHFLNFPLNSHGGAMPAAIASRCAHRQGKFWPMHDKLFRNQGSQHRETFLAHAKDLGLDTKAFESCLEDLDVRREVDADVRQGEAVGVSGTPSFFVNGIPYAEGVPTPDALKEMFPEDL